MLRLDSTVKLQAVLAGAVSTTQPQITVCASDQSSAGYAGLAPVRTATNNTTDVDILAAPAASTFRDVDFLNVLNRDTASITITIKFDQGGVDTIITTVTLLTLETLQYVHGSGWAAFASNGAMKTTSDATGILAAVNGGTGFGSYAVGDILYADTTTTLAKLPDVAAGSYLRSGGVNTAPVWSTTTLPNSATIGDVLFASATNVYSNLADVATGNALISGGVATAPSWGKIGLTTHVSGTLPVANGGTGTTTATGTAGSVVLSVGPTITGTLTATGLVDISGASAGQIKFPATQNPSADANTLDDYEEGTWTPTIGGATTAGTQTYSDQIGRYVKVGRLVSVECRIVMTAKDAATAGSLEIFGLPFTSANIAAAAAGMATATTSNITLTAAYTQIGLQVLPNTTTVFFIQNGSAQAAAAINSTGLAATSAVVMGGNYSV